MLNLTWGTTGDSIDHIGPWWTCLVDTGYVIDIGLSWQGMVCKQVRTSTESNASTRSLNPVEFSTLVCEHGIWLVTISGHYSLKIVLLQKQWKRTENLWKMQVICLLIEYNKRFIDQHLNYYDIIVYKHIYDMIILHTSAQLPLPIGHASIHRATSNQEVSNITFSCSLIKSLVCSSKHDNVGWLWVTTSYLTSPFVARLMSVQYGATRLTELGKVCGVNAVNRTPKLINPLLLICKQKVNK